MLSPMPPKAPLALLLAAGLAVPALAQVGSSPRQSRVKQDAGNGFPTWEREVDSSELQPLPEGRPGRYAPRWTIDLGAPATGVARIAGGFACVGLADGGALVIDAAGQVLRTVRPGAPAAGPPVECGTFAVIPTGDRFVAVDEFGVAWRSEAGARPTGRLDGGATLVAGAREGGILDALDAETGSLLWRTTTGAEITAGPAVGEGLVVVGAGGEAIAYAQETGALAWRVALGESVTSVGLQQGGLLASGLGITDRAKTRGPFIAGVDLRRSPRPARADWVLRVGGRCEAGPFILGDEIGFACDDGFVRALSRRKGLERWRVDLPVAARRLPARTGERLDFVLDRSGHAVSLSAENGAVLGWMTLPDPDETFVGPAGQVGGVTVAATTLQRVVGLGWEWLEVAEDEEPRQTGGAWQPPAARTRTLSR